MTRFLVILGTAVAVGLCGTTASAHPWHRHRDAAAEAAPAATPASPFLLTAARRPARATDADINDAFAIGELDDFGGHCGRADDYHYHVAPVHLEKVVGKGKPIAWALDGYPIYGYTEPDGSPVKGLDWMGGHEDANGNYHYHAQKRYPYLNGGRRDRQPPRGGGPTAGAGGRPAAPVVTGAAPAAGVLAPSSSAIGSDGRLPVEYSCDGAGISPPIEWKAGHDLRKIRFIAKRWSPRIVTCSELFGGLLEGLSHIAPRGLCTLLQVPPRLASGFTELIQLVAGHLLLGIEISHLLFPAGLGLVLQGVSFFTQPFDFFLHFREAGLEARLNIFLGLRGSECGGIDSLFRVATDVLGCDFAYRVLDRGLHAAITGHENRCTKQPPRARHGLTSCRTTKMVSVRVAFEWTR